MPDHHTGDQRRRDPIRVAINQHMYRHHENMYLSGPTQRRMERHDEIHWEARKNGVDLGHTHLPYQERESDLGMAQRYLREGVEGQRAQQLRELGASAPEPPQE